MKKFLGTLLLVLILGAPLAARAQVDPCSFRLTRLDPGCVQDLTDAPAIVNLILRLLALLRTVFWLFAVGMLIYAAYMYLFGGAGEKNVEKAKTVIRYAVIAMVVALIATGIPWLVANILK
jgi:hypothetical protein